MPPLSFVEELNQTVDWYRQEPHHRTGKPPRWDPDELVQMLADMTVSRVRGTATRVHGVRYGNPLEVILISGLLIQGVVLVLRLVRDWSNKKRADAAANQKAEAEAEWRETSTRFLNWLVDEAIAGRFHVPPGELLGMVTPPESDAVHRLSEDPITMKLIQPLAGSSPLDA